MDAKKAMAVLAAIQELVPAAKVISKAHGFIHKRTEAEINGIKVSWFGISLFIMRSLLTMQRAISCRSLPLYLMPKPRLSGIDL